MALRAIAVFDCTHRYDNGVRGVTYSVRLKNSLGATRCDSMVTVLLHNPPETWISLIPSREELEDERTSPTGNIWRVKGLFSFRSNLGREGIPVLHAEAVKNPFSTPNAVFVECSNRGSPRSDTRHEIGLYPHEEAHVFVSHLGPVRGKSPLSNCDKYFSNVLVGVVPLGAEVARTIWSRAKRTPFIRKYFQVDPATGRLVECGGPGDA